MMVRYGGFLDQMTTHNTLKLLFITLQYNIMKHTLITLVLLIACTLGFAQKTYLKIYVDDSNESVIMYPPGTEFELKTEDGYIIMKNSETPRVIEIKSYHKLIVLPSYKGDRDIYHLKSGKVELAATKKFFENNSKNETLIIDDDHITAHQKVTDSKIKIGYKNLEFELNNGIEFKYTDGMFYARLKNQYLDIKGKYIIESKLGILKLSFNPENGQVWWVFEPKN